MTDRALLDDLIAKLQEMQEQLSMAQLETTAQSLLAGRIRHLTILSHYVRARLEAMAAPASLPPAADAPTDPDSPKPG